MKVYVTSTIPNPAGGYLAAGRWHDVSKEFGESLLRNDMALDREAYDARLGGNTVEMATEKKATEKRTRKKK